MHFLWQSVSWAECSDPCRQTGQVSCCSRLAIARASLHYSCGTFSVINNVELYNEKGRQALVFILLRKCLLHNRLYNIIMA